MVDVDGCAEAIRLARLIHELMPDEATPTALMGLLLLTESRRTARTNAAGEVVVLAEQDRSRWDAGAVAEGLELVNESLRRTSGLADPYQLQAAIAAEHARAPSYDQTDWAEIVRLYDLLSGVAPSPASALARAVAVGERDGAAQGLKELDPLPASSRWHAVRAEFLARDGRLTEAVEAAERSLSGKLTEPERRYRERRRQEWLAAREFTVAEPASPAGETESRRSRPTGPGPLPDPPPAADGRTTWR